MPTPELQEFFAKIQRGDEKVVEAMLLEMDPFLRRVIRMRLLDERSRAPSTARTFSNRCSRISRRTRGRRARRSELGRAARLRRCRRTSQGPDEIAQERRHAGSRPEEWEPARPQHCPGS